ncbi:MAG: CBS domain-containing protein [Proteobacteria bacterium]|jgi:acetoin utilization protein AcuB|nr:CBS domain-containing protein [Pseudomonadota bacterium]
MNKLEFTVEEFTTPNPITASENTSVENLADLMKEYGIRHIPIMRGDEVVGIVSERDLAIVAGFDLREKSMVRAADLMIPDPVTVYADARLDEVALEMSQQKIGSVIVNEGNTLLGIFTATDALNALIEIARSARVSPCEKVDAPHPQQPHGRNLKP